MVRQGCAESSVVLGSAIKPFKKGEAKFVLTTNDLLMDGQCFLAIARKAGITEFQVLRGDGRSGSSRQLSGQAPMDGSH